MARLRTSDERIFFPWESGPGALRWFGMRRIQRVVLAVAIVSCLVAIASRERRRAGIRQTQATLLDVRRAMNVYLADHEGNCPPSLAALHDSGILKVGSRDAWGRPLRLICPASREGLPYELLSDGPDGEPGGLDRIE